MSDRVLTVEGVSKRFCTSLRRSMAYGARDIARNLMPGATAPLRLRAQEFWAVEAVSFTLDRGQAIAVMGRNGAGKSTLLKMINGLIKPDAGSIRVAGRVGAIIELGAGLAPLLTGRENIAMGARLAGLRGASERRLLDEVADFAGLDGSLDAPLQSYSSGMRARLAYALSAHLEPDVLLVDEALAVGDIAFQRKCVNHMRSYLARGGSLAFVSHHVMQIQAICSHAILLDRGRVVGAGDVAEIVRQMIDASSEAGDAAVEPENGDGNVEILALEAEPAGSEARTGQPLRLGLRVRAETPVELILAFAIEAPDRWTRVAGVASPGPIRIAAGEQVLSCTVPRLPLVSGQYRVRASLCDPATLYPVARIGHVADGLPLVVNNPPDRFEAVRMISGTHVLLEAHWT